MQAQMDVAPWQQVAKNFPDIPFHDFHRAVQVIFPSAPRLQGAAAMLWALAQVPGRGRLWRLYGRSAFFRCVSEWGYGFISSHRDSFYRLTNFFFGQDPKPNT